MRARIRPSVAKRYPTAPTNWVAVLRKLGGGEDELLDLGSYGRWHTYNLEVETENPTPENPEWGQYGP